MLLNDRFGSSFDGDLSFEQAVEVISCLAHDSQAHRRRAHLAVGSHDGTYYVQTTGEVGEGGALTNGARVSDGDADTAFHVSDAYVTLPRGRFRRGHLQITDGDLFDLQLYFDGVVVELMDP